MYQANENSHAEIPTYTINNVLNQNVKGDKTSKACNILFAILVSQTICAYCSSKNETQSNAIMPRLINHPSASRVKCHDHACLFISRCKN